MGQLSDPYQQGEDELAITISGLPGQLVEPDTPAPVDGDRGGDAGGGDGGGEVAVFDLDEWSDIERSAVTDRLREAGIPHGWEGASLQVAAADEALVANVLDIVDGGPADAVALDGDRDQVAYDLSEWDDDLITALVRELDARDVAFGWDGDELYVYADDEDDVDELVDRVAHPHQIPAEPDDGPAGAELLGDLFVAADRLRRDGEDPEGTVALLEMLEHLDASDPPYGLGEPEWGHLRERVALVGDELLADEVDADAVATAAGELRTALRPYV